MMLFVSIGERGGVARAFAIYSVVSRAQYGFAITHHQSQGGTNLRLCGLLSVHIIIINH